MLVGWREGKEDGEGVCFLRYGIRILRVFIMWISNIFGRVFFRIVVLKKGRRYDLEVGILK